jgi:hypothetical protein
MDNKREGRKGKRHLYTDLTVQPIAEAHFTHAPRWVRQVHKYLITRGPLVSFINTWRYGNLVRQDMEQDLRAAPIARRCPIHKSRKYPPRFDMGCAGSLASIV